MKKLLLAGLLALGTMLGVATATDAAPITCPGAQVAEKTGEFWECVNPAGNTNEADRDKNPNGHPNTD